MARMVTLDDLKGKSGGDDDHDGDTYAGGETSGLAVAGNPRHRGVGGDKVDSVIDRAHEGSAARGGPVEGDRKDMEEHTITFYKNGFVVNDGPLRGYDDAENKEFMDDVGKGFVPRELQGERTADGRPKVGVAIADKRGEDYRPPTPPSYTAFSGEGQSAGGSSAEAAGTVSASGAVAGAGAFSVDESAPTTTVAISLLGGSRLRAKFNHTHTVGDLQRYVAEHGSASGAFVLIGGFPPKPLSDASLTLEAAGLLGAAVRQKAA